MPVGRHADISRVLEIYRATGCTHATAARLGLSAKGVSKIVTRARRGDGADLPRTRRAPTRGSA